MDNQRLFAWALFGLLLMMTWQAWQADYGPEGAAPEPAATTPAAGVVPPEDGLPAVPSDLPSELPAEESAGLAAPPATPAPVASQPTGRTIRVSTDVLDIEIALNGGDIVQAALPQYPIDKDRPDEPVLLLTQEPIDFAVFQTQREVGFDTESFQTGLRAGDGAPEPNHLAPFTAKADRYEIQDGQDTLIVPLTWQREDGLRVTKRFEFNRGSYQIDLTMRVDNASPADWTAAPYGRIVHIARLPDRSMFNVDSYSFQGPVLYDGKKYEKHAIDDLQDDGPVTLEGAARGWIAAIEHHFLSAIVPPRDNVVNYDIRTRSGRFVATAVSQARVVAAGETEDYALTLFVGPKLQDQLESIDESLPLTVDYGILTLLADPLFWVLSAVHSFVGNWGWSIVLVTLLIKLVFYKLTEKSGRSMAKMRRLQPRIKAMQERYKDDRAKQSAAMMELYKREKINPAAGCLPILIQMPFFLAFYWVLLESVEMRQAPFMFWIQDLSSRDPFFVLPLLMGGAMLLQQQLNPVAADPVQAKVMKVLPIVFTVFFAFFPAGLVLYWLTNTALGVAQQWQINKVVEQEERKHKAPKKKD